MLNERGVPGIIAGLRLNQQMEEDDPMDEKRAITDHNYAHLRLLKYQKKIIDDKQQQSAQQHQQLLLTEAKPSNPQTGLFAHQTPAQPPVPSPLVPQTMSAQTALAEAPPITPQKLTARSTGVTPESLHKRRRITATPATPVIAPASSTPAPQDPVMAALNRISERLDLLEGSRQQQSTTPITNQSALQDPFGGQGSSTSSGSHQLFRQPVVPEIQPLQLYQRSTVSMVQPPQLPIVGDPAVVQDYSFLDEELEEEE